jgi:uncharacterized membrane protein
MSKAKYKKKKKEKKKEIKELARGMVQVVAEALVLIPYTDTQKVVFCE